MKTWQIFAIGAVAALVLFSLHAYESALAGVAAVGLIATVVVGFCLSPRKEVFYLRTTSRVPDPDYVVSIEHDRIALRVELVRLWLLFIPTFVAVAFLLVTAANGKTWNISLFEGRALDWFNIGTTYPVLLFFRALIFGVVALLTAWVTERWILRDANACSADSVHVNGKRITYSFKDPLGEYYGGQGIPLGATCSWQLRSIVFYKTRKPELSKIAMCCLFHRIVIVGRGLTDLDNATVTTAMKVKPASQAV